MSSTVETPAGSRRQVSAFAEHGFNKSIAQLIELITDLYLEDATPWVVGYSGGKDSTAVLSLVWMALSGLPIERRHKTVHVISTDTLVENPVVAAWVGQSLNAMGAAAAAQHLPIEPHRLTPEIRDSFWVNLIGRGYPAPRNKFRWCTSRLKINPSNKFIKDTVEQSGEAILVLGTRKQESITRGRLMEKLQAQRKRDLLSPNASLPNCLVFSPVEEWSNDDVWTFLVQSRNPWGWSNKDLLGMYQGASADGECPLVVDGSTPSCGDSRFGCWVCTMVEQDKSMAAMIQNDQEKEWMRPLLELRNDLDRPWENKSLPLQPPATGSLVDASATSLSIEENDRYLRDYRRMSGAITLFHDAPIHGPYTQKAREMWLSRLLAAQTWVRKHGPSEVQGIDLITLPELQEIRKIWITDKHEIEDNLPRIYRDLTGDAFPGTHFDDRATLGQAEMGLLLETAGGDVMHFQTLRELLTVAGKYRTMARRQGLYDALAKAIERGFYENKEDAAEFARERVDAKAAIKDSSKALKDLALFKAVEMRQGSI
jgi:DNA sulfur modification protein DndC